MELTLSWPSGYYSLYSAQRDGNDVCPEESGFQWTDGSVTNRMRWIADSANRNLVGIKEAPSGEHKMGVKFGFCTKIKESGSKYFSPKWPRGKYCILRKSTDPGQGKCPDGKLEIVKRVLVFFLKVGDISFKMFYYPSNDAVCECMSVYGIDQSV